MKADEKDGKLPENPKAVQVDVKFTEEPKNGNYYYKVVGGDILLTWQTGAVTEYHFDYPGKRGYMQIPFPGVFEPDKKGNDQVFKLKKNKKLILKLRARDKVEAALGHPADGSFSFGVAIFDNKHETYAIGNSPPKMVLGP
jgi:hypothetical protein